MVSLVSSGNAQQRQNGLDTVPDALKRINVQAALSDNPIAYAASAEKYIASRLASSIRNKYFLAKRLTSTAMHDVVTSLAEEINYIYTNTYTTTSLIQYVGRGFKYPTESVYNMNLLLEASFSVLAGCQSVYSFYDNFKYLYENNLEAAVAKILLDEKQQPLIDAFDTIVKYLEDKLAIAINIKQNQTINTNPIDYSNEVTRLKEYYDSFSGEPDKANYILRRIMVIGFIYTIGKRKSLMTDITVFNNAVVIEQLFNAYKATMIQLGFGTKDDYEYCTLLFKTGIGEFIVNGKLLKDYAVKTDYPDVLLRDENAQPNMEKVIFNITNFDSAYMGIASKVNHSYCVKLKEHLINNEECNCDVF